jgi:hypothetical protein
MRDFQRQERVWQQALHRAEIFAIVNTGLAPFPVTGGTVFPSCRFTSCASISWRCPGFSFLFKPQPGAAPSGRHAAGRNAAFGNPRLRHDEYLDALRRAGRSCRVLWPSRIFKARPASSGGTSFDLQTIGEWLALFLTLMPVAVTLALLWKIKEAIFTSFFELETPTGARQPGT